MEEVKDCAKTFMFGYGLFGFSTCSSGKRARDKSSSSQL